MLKDRRVFKCIYLAFVAMLLVVMTFSLCGCSKTEEPQEESEETEEEDISIYGDPSLGIDAGAGEIMRDYRSILLGGIDDGNRSDIMIVLCINEETKEVRMFSVNRDTYMQIAGGDTVTLYDREWDYNRCNEAYNAGGKYALMKELNEHLDLNIKEFIGVDWPTAAKFIDALGGVTVTVDEGMLEWINKGAGLSKYGAENYQISSAGTQTLNGWQTVQYLRVRKYKGGGTTVRDDNNRALAQDLLNKAKSMSAEEISAIYDEIADDIDTNMSRNTLTDTIALLASTDLIDKGDWPYETVKKWEPDGSAVYQVPESLYSNVLQLHQGVFDQLGYLPSKKVQELNDLLADREKNYLKDSK